MSANDEQVGGNHYKVDGEQHWDRMWRLYGRGYFVGCATKYIERYHLKNGIQDLEKARHFIDKLIELESINTQITDSQVSSVLNEQHELNRMIRKGLQNPYANIDQDL